MNTITNILFVVLVKKPVSMLDSAGLSRLVMLALSSCRCSFLLNCKAEKLLANASHISLTTDITKESCLLGLIKYNLQVVHGFHKGKPLRMGHGLRGHLHSRISYWLLDLFPSLNKW